MRQINDGDSAFLVFFFSDARSREGNSNVKLAVYRGIQGAPLCWSNVANARCVRQSHCCPAENGQGRDKHGALSWTVPSEGEPYIYGPLAYQAGTSHENHQARQTGPECKLENWTHGGMRRRRRPIKRVAKGRALAEI